VHSSSSLDPIQDDGVALAKVMLCGSLWQFILITQPCILVILKINFVLTANICCYFVLYSEIACMFPFGPLICVLKA